MPKEILCEFCNTHYIPEDGLVHTCLINLFGEQRQIEIEKLFDEIIVEEEKRDADMEELKRLRTENKLLRSLLSAVDDLVDTHAPLCNFLDGYGDPCSCNYPKLHEKVKAILDMDEDE